MLQCALSRSIDLYAIPIKHPLEIMVDKKLREVMLLKIISFTEINTALVHFCYLFRKEDHRISITCRLD